MHGKSTRLEKVAVLVVVIHYTLVEGMCASANAGAGPVRSPIRKVGGYRSLQSACGPTREAVISYSLSTSSMEIRVKMIILVSLSVLPSAHDRNERHFGEMTASGPCNVRS